MLDKLLSRQLVFHLHVEPPLHDSVNNVLQVIHSLNLFDKVVFEALEVGLHSIDL